MVNTHKGKATMAELQNQFLGIKVSADFLNAIDDWRSEKRPILNRSEAVRVLTIKGLETETDPKRKP